jgi:hypothetical protein
MWKNIREPFLLPIHCIGGQGQDQDQDRENVPVPSAKNLQLQESLKDPQRGELV